MIEYDSSDWKKIGFAYYGTVLPRILSRLLLLAGWTAIIASLFYLELVDFNVGTTIHSIMGLALGLLLVFRTNTSYDRYWEGRRQWAEVTNCSRNLTLRIDSFVPTTEAELRRECSELVSAYAIAVRETLREGIEAEHLIDICPSLRERILLWENRPNAILAHLGERVRIMVDNGWVTNEEYLSFDDNLTDLTNCLGAMERIRFTPFPFAYINQIHVFLSLYFISLPLALAPAIGFAAIPAVMAIAYALLGIEEIGVEIEDPFGDDPNDLPAEEICAQIAIEAKEILIRYVSADNYDPTGDLTIPQDLLDQQAKRELDEEEAATEAFPTSG